MIRAQPGKCALIRTDRRVRKKWATLLLGKKSRFTRHAKRCVVFPKGCGARTGGLANLGPAHQPCRMNSLNRFADPVYCIVRLIVGLAYACHGGQKLFAYPGGGHGVDGLAFIAGIIELVGGILIAFGLLTRIAAFLASGEMAVAYFMFYVGTVPTLEAKFFPIMNGGELALVNCWIFFFMIFYGSGQWSIDALWRKDRSNARPT